MFCSASTRNVAYAIFCSRIVFVRLPNALHNATKEKPQRSGRGLLGLGSRELAQNSGAWLTICYQKGSGRARTQSVRWKGVGGAANSFGSNHQGIG